MPPQNITDVITYTTPVQSVADGDGATGANFLLGPQALANRTAFLNNLTSNPAAGVSAIRNVANAAALTAISAPTNGSVALIPGAGLYAYNSSSAATVDNVFVVNGPAGVGRWLHEIQGIANTSPGIGVVSAAGRIPGAIVPNAVVAVATATQSANQIIPAAQAALLDVTSVTVTLTVAVGDILIVDASAPVYYGGTTAGLVIVSNIAAPGTGVYAAGTDGSLVATSAGTITCPLVQRLVCGAAGSVTVKLQTAGTGASTAYTVGVTNGVITAYATIRVQQIRP